MTVPGPDEIIGKIDAMVDRAPEPENAVLADDARVVRWTGPFFALFSLILLPWTIYLAGSLPARQVSTNYGAAWAGFDVLLMLTLASTAYFALRRSRYLATAASAAAALLVVDAWFDVLTTPAGQRIESIGLAAVVELRGLRLWGAPAWWLWGLAHVLLLAGGRNRAAVVLNWLWAYLTYRRGTRLITGNTMDV